VEAPEEIAMSATAGPNVGDDLPRPPSDFVARLRGLHRDLQSHLWTRMGERARAGTDDHTLAAAVGHEGGDTIFALDRVADEVLIPACAAWADAWGLPFVLVAEGQRDGRAMFPDGADPASARFVVIADPVDGTRGLMYGKRSAWSLAAAAPVRAPGWWARGEAPARLADIRVAVQTELPTHRAYLADQAWAVRGAGAAGVTRDLLVGKEAPLRFRPAANATLEHGFASLFKGLPWAKADIAALEDRLLRELAGPGMEPPPTYDDQYISTGGQLFALMTGQDRFIADLRPQFAAASGHLPCHPNDICAALVATEAGVVLTDGTGAPLDAPLDTETPIAWIGYANATLRAAIEPVLLRLLAERGAG
jgi:hypothetical protein